MAKDKQIEDAVKQCRNEFLDLFRQSPLVLTLCTAKDHRYIDVNETFERETGWNRNEVIGRTAFEIGLWADPGQRAELLKQILSGGVVRNVDVRIRVKNGDMRTGSLSAMLIEINGQRCVLCLVADVTDRKRAEEANQAAERLSSMGHRLIQAQEDERKLIARELHEYIDRLLLLSMELEHSGKVETARRQIEDLVTDFQSLLQRVHSAKLEYLGLAAAAASFCKELSIQKKIDIQFTSEGVAKELPEKIASSLYLIMQEALQNAISYSGAKRIHVKLVRGPNKTDLTVRDSGVGFDAAALKGPGFGLMIMRERLKQVGGELSIESQPGRGTTIHAQVPLHFQEKSAGASG